MPSALSRSLILLASLLAAGHVQAMVIDANLADWGVQRTGQASDWNPTPGLGIHATIEDQNSAFLGPGYGGQAYDAEALYARVDAGRLFIALATGHHPLTVQRPASNSFGAGDFAIDFGMDGRYEVGINFKHMTPNGRESFGIEGGVYGNAVWAYGLWDAAGRYNPANPDPAHPTHLIGGSYLGMATLAYTTHGATGYGQWASHQHFFYEMSLDLDLLTSAGWDGNAFNIHWTQNCANDSIIVDPPGAVPEPATLALIPLGLLGLAALRARRPNGRAETV